MNNFTKKTAKTYPISASLFMSALTWHIHSDLAIIALLTAIILTINLIKTRIISAKEKQS